ncbi:cyclase family protein [Acidocella sp.]|jgi:kynurenine formamidase|uniref:cyclase family protein n=1 Tax=Acidocella sp. TaxID=50710 RepID=UPI002F409B47
MSEIRWKQRPDGSNWGDFGPDDQRGRLNLLTPERVVRAVAEVKTGHTFCLSLPLELPGGNLLNANRHPPVRQVTRRKQGHPNVNYPFSLEHPSFVDMVCDDAVTLYTQYSTQWDALAHIGQSFDANGDGIPEPVYYNGYRGGVDILGPDEGGPTAKALGIEAMAETCVQGRGVLVDLHARYKAQRKLVGYDDLMEILNQDGITIEEGDMLCLHTGFAEAVLAMRDNPDPEILHKGYAVLDGRDERLLQWIDKSGIAVLIADNYAVEQIQGPIEGCAHCATMPLHQACLFRLGIHLGELWYLTPLARWLKAHGRHRFLLTAPPLRLTGSFGSPVTPVATV